MFNRYGDADCKLADFFCDPGEEMTDDSGEKL